MPSIPTVPGTTRVATPSPNLKLDAGPLNAPAQAAMNMGQAFGRVGQQVGEFGLKLQEAKNYGIAADADRQMRQEAADFQASRAGRDDEENWESEWNDRSDALWGRLNDTLPLSPVLKRQLSENYKNWK